jgi:hypothetical protein
MKLDGLDKLVLMLVLLTLLCVSCATENKKDFVTQDHGVNDVSVLSEQHASDFSWLTQERETTREPEKTTTTVDTVFPGVWAGDKLVQPPHSTHIVHVKEKGKVVEELHSSASSTAVSVEKKAVQAEEKKDLTKTDQEEKKSKPAAGCAVGLGAGGALVLLIAAAAAYLWQRLRRV